LSELGLLDEFLTLPHEKAVQLEADVGTEKVIAADFSHLKLKAPFVAFIPQWDFLNFIVKHASAHPSFHLKMNAEATGLIEEDGHVVGVMAKSGEAEVQARRGRLWKALYHSGKERPRDQRLRRSDGCALVQASPQRNGPKPDAWPRR
jgi:2-polyprenyl-6-methoxyphenol hydroxylase-like FAD-dependent oxidoreductase